MLGRITHAEAGIRGRGSAAHTGPPASHSAPLPHIGPAGIISCSCSLPGLFLSPPVSQTAMTLVKYKHDLLETLQGLPDVNELRRPQSGLQALPGQCRPFPPGGLTVVLSLSVCFKQSWFF